MNSIWNKLILRSLYLNNSISVYEDVSLGEDSSTLLRLAACAKKIVHIDDVLYHYNLASCGMSQKVKVNINEYNIGYEHLLSFFEDKGFILESSLYLKLKLYYYPLVFLGLKKAEKMGYTDYNKASLAFLEDYNSIVHSPFFYRLKIKYRFFVLLYSRYARIYHRREQRMVQYV